MTFTNNHSFVCFFSKRAQRSAIKHQQGINIISPTTMAPDEGTNVTPESGKSRSLVTQGMGEIEIK